LKVGVWFECVAMFVDEGPATKESPPRWETNLIEVLSSLERLHLRISQQKNQHRPTCDRLTCLEDGRSFKSLKKHLWVTHKMTPSQYRRKWNLPVDYPMTASRNE
jgi:predicted transcriptional regulator